MTDTAEAQTLKDYEQPLPHEENVTEGAVVSVIDQAEINQQISTAKRFPRSLQQFRRRMYEMVTWDVDTADSCIYAIPRDNKMIDGPSIRFAELLIGAWGNNRASAEVTMVDEEFVTAQGTFFDLETNAAVQGKVMRRITGKPSKEHPRGRRFSQDMIGVTGNAACSIALRNAILRGVPKALWAEIFQEAKKVAAGDAKTFSSRRDATIKSLGVQGATPEMIFALLGVKGVEDMNTEHLVHLKGLHNAIRDGETTIEQAFSPETMLRPGEAAPPRPKQSDFARKEEPKQAATPAAEQKKPEPAQESASAAPAADPREADRQDIAGDYYKKLEGLTKIRDVADLRDEAVNIGVFTAEEEGKWLIDCNAKSEAIMAKAKAGKK